MGQRQGVGIALAYAKRVLQHFPNTAVQLTSLRAWKAAHQSAVSYQMSATLPAQWMHYTKANLPQHGSPLLAMTRLQATPCAVSASSGPRSGAWGVAPPGLHTGASGVAQAPNRHLSSAMPMPRAAAQAPNRLLSSAIQLPHAVAWCHRGTASHTTGRGVGNTTWHQAGVLQQLSLPSRVALAHRNFHSGPSAALRRAVQSRWYVHIAPPVPTTEALKCTIGRPPAHALLPGFSRGFACQAPRGGLHLARRLASRGWGLEAPGATMWPMWGSPGRGAAQRGFAASSRQRVQRSSGDSAAHGLYLLALVVLMIGLTYASVPLYRMFCQATGFGGTVQEGRRVEAMLKAREEAKNEELERAAASRELTVSFNADVTDGLPWKFVPTQRAVKVKPGQSTLVFYTAENLSSKAITGVSTYNVAPQQAGFYFNKIQCFCFEEQKLRPGEKIDMPVFFYIDPEFATDPRLKGIDHLTLSYTFFKVEEEADQSSPVTQSSTAAIG